MPPNPIQKQAIFHLMHSHSGPVPLFLREKLLLKSIMGHIAVEHRDHRFDAILSHEIRRDGSLQSNSPPEKIAEALMHTSLHETPILIALCHTVEPDVTFHISYFGDPQYALTVRDALITSEKQCEVQIVGSDLLKIETGGKPVFDVPIPQLKISFGTKSQNGQELHLDEARIALAQGIGEGVYNIFVQSIYAETQASR